MLNMSIDVFVDMIGLWLQAYVVRMTGLLQLSDGHEDSQAGKQVEVRRHVARHAAHLCSKPQSSGSCSLMARCVCVSNCLCDGLSLGRLLHLSFETWGAPLTLPPLFPSHLTSCHVAWLLALQAVVSVVRCLSTGQPFWSFQLQFVC